MAKNDFRVTSIFKIIVRICMENVEFCRKASKFLPKRCMFIFCIFYLNEKELKFLTIPPTQKKEDRERDEQKHNPTSKTFLKLLKHFL